MKMEGLEITKDYNEITKVISRNIELERKKSVNRSPLYKHLSLETPVPLVTRLRRDIDIVLGVESAILVFNVYHADPAAEVRGESQQIPKLSVVPSSTCPRFGQSEGEITTANTVLPKGCPDTMKTVLRLIVSNNCVLRAGRLIDSLSYSTFVSTILWHSVLFLNVHLCVLPFTFDYSGNHRII